MSAIEYSPARNGAIREPRIQHAVQPVHLVGVAVDGVGDLLRRVVAEVVRLPGHRPEPAHLPEQPLLDLHAGPLVGRIELAGLAAEILQDGARLEHRDRLAARAVGIDDRRHAVVRRDRQELRLELVAPADVDGLDLVGEPALLQHDGDLVPVGRGPVVQLDGLLRHGCVPLPNYPSQSSCLPERGSEQASAATTARDARFHLCWFWATDPRIVAAVAAGREAMRPAGVDVGGQAEHYSPPLTPARPRTRGPTAPCRDRRPDTAPARRCRARRAGRARPARPASAAQWR